MKARVCVLALTLALVGVWGTSAPAQDGEVFVPDMASSSNGGLPFFQRLHSPNFPGMFWASFTGTDENVGFLGSYFTLGGKTRLMDEDLLGGRWLMEGRLHVSAESGQLFSNLGIERVMSIDPADSDISFGIWWDWDDDRQGDFAHTFQQLGFSSKLKTPSFDLTGNIYVPIKDTEHLVGSPDNCFFENFIVVRNGFDIALEGFDGELRLRPFALAMFMGTVDIGGYYYRTDVDFIESFAGVRFRVGLTTPRGCQIYAGLSHDDRFSTTVYGQVVVNSQIFGQYDPSGRDLEPTIRNDHIVRIQQSPEFLIDPDTGAPYRVIHVDNANTAAGGGDGTFENPYTELALADGTVNPGNSLVDDIIFVHEGAEVITVIPPPPPPTVPPTPPTIVTSNEPYNDSITLLDRQFLLGDGVTHLIPSANAGNFLFCNDSDGVTPTIIGDVTLANDNVVRGFTINPVNTGITANGQVGNTQTVVDQVTITGGNQGVNINNSAGQYRFTDVTIGGAGMSMAGMALSTSGTAFRVASTAPAFTAPIVTFDGDIINEAGLAVDIDGLAAGGSVTFLQGGTIVDQLGGLGIRINNVAGGAGAMVVSFNNDVDLLASTAGGANGVQISADNLGGGANITSGTFTFADIEITDRTGISLQIDEAGGQNQANVVFTGAITTPTTAGNGAVSVDVNNNGGAGGGSLLFNAGSAINYTMLNAGQTGVRVDGNDVAYTATFQNTTVDASNGAIGIAITDIVDIGGGNEISFVGPTTILGAGVDGVLIADSIGSPLDADGDINFAALTIQNAAGAAFHVDRGAHDIVANITGGITNVAGESIVITNTVTDAGGDGSVTISGVVGIDDDGAGIVISNNAAGGAGTGDLNININVPIDIDDPAEDGITIQGNQAGAGGNVNIAFNNSVDVDTTTAGANGAVDINANVVSGANIVAVSFTDLDVNALLQPGLRVNNAAANEINQVNITTGNLTAAANTALSVSNSAGIMNFANISSTGGANGIFVNNLNDVGAGGGFSAIAIANVNINNPGTNGMSLQNIQMDNSFTVSGGAINLNAANRTGVLLNTGDINMSNYTISGVTIAATVVDLANVTGFNVTGAIEGGANRPNVTLNLNTVDLNSAGAAGGGSIGFNFNTGQGTLAGSAVANGGNTVQGVGPGDFNYADEGVVPLNDGDWVLPIGINGTDETP